MPGPEGSYLVMLKLSASSERMFAAVPDTGIRPSWTGVGRLGLFIVDEARGWGITLKGDLEQTRLMPCPAPEGACGMSRADCRSRK
jgi:hypothetical protein